MTSAALAAAVLALAGLTACTASAPSTPSAAASGAPALPTTPASGAYLSPADVSKYSDLVNIPPAVAALMVTYHVPGLSPAVGHAGASYLTQVTSDGEGEVALGNSAGSYVLPTASSIQAGLPGLINTPADETISYEYAIVSISQASATRAQDLRAFLDWAIGAGTAQLAQANVQPLPAPVVMLSRAQIAKIEG